MDKEVKIFMWIMVMILTVLLMLSSVFQTAPECFSQQPTICEPQTPCTWARDQISQLLHDEKTPVSIKIEMIEAAMQSLRNTKDYIILFEHPEYQGTVTLIDKNTKDDIQLLDFPLYYGREFSIMIPKGLQMKFTPHKGGSYPYDPLVIGEGHHPRIVYYKGPIQHIRIVSPV